MKKGKQLLIQIQNLITEIDQSHPSIYFKKNPIRQKSRQTSFSALREQCFNQNKINKTKQTVEQHQKFQLVSPDREQHTFKVENKTSIYLNSRKKNKPIYQRVEQIQNKKIEGLHKIREKYPNKQTRIEQQDKQVIQMIEAKRKRQKKYSISELSDKLKEHQQKQKQRLQKINSFIQLATEKENQKYTDKPFVRKKSIEVWKNYQDKQKLSNCVFARFEQYEVVRKQKFEKKAKEIRNKVTPFMPIISSYSKRMISQLSQRALSQNTSHSLSCNGLPRSDSKSLTNRQNRSTALPTDRNS